MSAGMWLLAAAVAWVAAAAPIAVVIGRAIHNADVHAPSSGVEDEPQVYVPREWIA